MSQKLDNVQLQEVPSRSNPNYTEVERFQMAYDKDNIELTRLGKRPVLKRNFGFMTMFGFNCTVMETWEIMMCQFGGNFTNGGFAGAVYGFLICWIGTVCVFTSMAELASMAPTSGGQYHWVSMLAPKSYQKFLSYIVGWFNTIGWQAIAAIGGFLVGNLIQGLIIINNPDYDPKAWQVTLILWATILFSVFVNTILSQFLPKIEGLILIFHVLTFFAVLIPLVYMAPHTDAKTVFTMSEEIRNASSVVPKVIVGSLLVNGVLAFLTLLSILFCIGNLDYVLEFPSLPFIAVIFQGIDNKAGTTAMVAIITILIIFAAVSFVATASRMTWSFARDRGLPGWKYLSKVDPRTSIPTTAVAVTMVLSCLLGLINIGSSVAFNDVLSLIIAGLYTSYLIGNVLLLWHRVRGTIGPYDDAQTGPTNIVQAGKLTWGPWKVPEPLGTIINIVGILYLIVVLFFSYWPTAMNPGAEGMNYSVLMVGAVAIWAVVYYFVWAHKIYTGPIIEVDFSNLS
ncbi:hypothetical protein B7494_g5542 [Chlorociboria aeruginascens]|nr:hypothetical protein B7494_g5542 [Chlorociboria aeruginascens]